MFGVRQRSMGQMAAKLLVLWQPLAVGAMALCLAGCGAPDAKHDIVGTWQRKHEGKVVEQLTFNADGTYETFNPQTGGTRESGRYSVSADGKYRHMRPADGANYQCRFQFKGKDAFDDWQQLVNTKLEVSYERLK
jgi:hypothetical protein